MSVGGIFRAAAHWIADENPGSAKMETEVFGLWDALQGTWDPSFVPVLTATGTDPTLGTAPTASCRFFRIGFLVFYEIHFKLGTGTPTAGSGTYDISLPVAARYSTGSSPSFMCGVARLFNTSPNLTNGICRLQNGTPPTLRIELNDGTGFVTNNNPWVWSSPGDQIDLQGFYEAAP